MIISLIIGSTRQGRFSEKPAQWILQELKKRESIEARLLDLRDFPMPFFDQPLPPAMAGRPPYEHEVVKKWTAQIAASDGFVFVTPNTTTAHPQWSTRPIVWTNRKGTVVYAGCA
jgi:NAD(P)H-dependent FMN reductase